MFIVLSLAFKRFKIISEDRSDHTGSTRRPSAPPVLSAAMVAFWFQVLLSCPWRRLRSLRWWAGLDEPCSVGSPRGRLAGTSWCRGNVCGRGRGSTPLFDKAS